MDRFTQTGACPMIKTLPPVLSRSLTQSANRQGIKGRVMIHDHSYFLYSPDYQTRKRLGFTVAEVSNWIARKAVSLPMFTVETENAPAPANPDQIELIAKPGQLSLF